LLSLQFDQDFPIVKSIECPNFQVGPKTVQVIYRGLAPDTFKDTSDVVVRGKLDQKKMVFYADHLLAKCASKYEAKLNHQSVKL
jgi:cytochrome c-type biogenesis protein CcmE